jgi:hypothetical protein
LRYPGKLTDQTFHRMKSRQIFRVAGNIRLLMLVWK